MKKVFKWCLMMFVVCILPNTLVAQTDVRILDLKIVPVAGTSSDYTELAVSFKINKANKASKVQFWLGTSENRSDVFTAIPTISTTGNATQITYNGTSLEVKNFEINFKIKLSKQQYDAYKIATVFVETTDGKVTTRLFYEKK